MHDDLDLTQHDDQPLGAFQILTTSEAAWALLAVCILALIIAPVL